MIKTRFKVNGMIVDNKCLYCIHYGHELLSNPVCDDCFDFGKFKPKVGKK
jgi:hypothetical protein